MNNCVNTHDVSYADDESIFLFLYQHARVGVELRFERRSDQLYSTRATRVLCLCKQHDPQAIRNVIMPFMNDKFNLTMGYKTVSSLSSTWYFNPSMGTYAATFHPP